MKIIEALEWRYAAKRMTGVKIPDEKLDTILDAIALAPSSFGLQPYSILVIENKELLDKIKPIADGQMEITEVSALLVFAAWENVTMERIEAYITRIATVRPISEERLLPLKERLVKLLNNPPERNFVWCAKQAYIALGIGLAAAAMEQIDSTPMEGFKNEQLDELLGLKEMGLRSQTLLALGYHDIIKDTHSREKKVRREKDKLFIHFS